MRLFNISKLELQLQRNMSASLVLMSIGHILLCYIMFLSFNKPFGHGATVVEKSKSHASPPPCSGPGKGLRGPCSPFGQKNSAAASNQTLAKDERRVQVMNSSSYNTRKSIGEDGSEYSEFLVTVGFGTPVQYFKLILDTGSYVTWVRCQQRCTTPPCEQQQYYDPSSSSTSSNAPCWTTLSCNYNPGYLDGSQAEGFFMVDTLFIGNEHEIPDFVLLCATDDTGDFGKADGILGLGMAGDDFGSYSLTYQTKTIFDNVFCYCFPTSDNSMGYVYFGEQARQNCRNSDSYTPLVENPSDHPSEYFVNLMAITIGQKRIEISSDESAGTFIDSGTVITRLPSYVYSALCLEFQGFMAEFPRASPDEVLDTCYNLSGYDVPTIPMVLHFENLDVPLDQTGVVSKVDGMSRVCLAFAAKQDESNPTIIGSHQQRKLAILYNVPYQRVEIGPGNC